MTPDTGQPVAGWTTSNNLVRALVADSGDRLYVGGSFGRIGGKAIPRLAAVTQSTGAVDVGSTPQPAATVRALSLSDDDASVYVGGGFSTIAGVARPGAAELNAASGAATSSPHRRRGCHLHGRLVEWAPVLRDDVEQDLDV